MGILIKTFTSGKRRLQQRFTTCSLLQIGLLYGMFVLLLPSVTCDDLKDTTTPNSWNITNLDRLRLQLFTNYDKNAHPAYHGEPSNITLGISVNYIDIDEASGKMTLHSWLRINWIDEKRSWNARDYDNITQVHLRPSEIWMPDITLFNSAGDKSDYVGDTQVLLAYDGSFLWVPPAVYTAYCSLNLRLWPYDKQTCKVKIGSLSTTRIDARAVKLKEDLDYNELVQSTEWEIISGSSSYHQQDYYNYVEFKFELERRSSMYTAVIFTPASCIILLTLSTFWLPPQMGEKILLNGIVIVVIAAFLMYFAQLLPILAENTPLVVLFYSSSLLLLSISTIVAVFVLYLSTAKHKRRLPEFMRNILNGPLGTILLLESFSLESEPRIQMHNGTKELSEPPYENPVDSMAEALSINPNSEPSNRSIQFDWVLLATAVDRIFFLCYCLAFIILAIVYAI